MEILAKFTVGLTPPSPEGVSAIDKNVCATMQLCTIIQCDRISGINFKKNDLKYFKI